VVTFLIFAMGIATVVLSGAVSIRFAQYHKELLDKDQGLARAISFQLVGEAIIGFGTLVFATAAHFGWLDGWSVELQSYIRLVMFFATSWTTYHLYRTLQSIR
jgi:hypothetical protein